MFEIFVATVIKFSSNTSVCYGCNNHNNTQSNYQIDLILDSEHKKLNNLKFRLQRGSFKKANEIQLNNNIVVDYITLGLNCHR